MLLKRAGYIFIFLTCLAARVELFASGPGTTGANFLKIPVGARETALGGAFTSAAAGPGALFYNPAGLSLTETPEVSYSYNNYFSGISQQWLGATLPAPYGAWGVGVNYLNVKAFDAYDSADNRTGSVSAYDLAAYLGWGAALRTGLELLPVARYGATLKYITQRLDSENASGFAADAGLIFPAGLENLAFGLGVENFAASRLDFIGAGARPARKFKTGVSYGLAAPGGSVAATLFADMNFPEDGSDYVSAGLENTFYGLVTLRAGYSSFGEISSGLNFGLGLGLPRRGGRELRLDYSFGSTYDLGSIHRFGVACKFGGTEGARKSVPAPAASPAAPAPVPATPSAPATAPPVPAPASAAPKPGNFGSQLELLYGPDPELSAAAAEYLAGLNDPRAIEHFAALLSSGKAEWKLAAVRGLGLSGGTRASEELGKALRDHNPGVRKAAARAISARNAAGAGAALEEALKTERSEDVKSAIIRALVNLGAPEAAPGGTR